MFGGTYPIRTDVSSSSGRRYAYSAKVPLFGVSGGIWTRIFHIHSVGLYQLSYTHHNGKSGPRYDGIGHPPSANHFPYFAAAQVML